MKNSGWLSVLFCLLVYACAGDGERTAEPINPNPVNTDSVVVTTPVDMDTLSAEGYVVYIDSLVSNHLIESVSSLGPSSCCGVVEGYYFNGNLVYLTATLNEDYGYTRRDCYFRGSDICRIIETIHGPLPEWGTPMPDQLRDGENAEITIDEIRTIVLPASEMTISRDGEEIFYYPESHEYYLNTNIAYAEEMRKKVEQAYTLIPGPGIE